MFYNRIIKTREVDTMEKKEFGITSLGEKIFSYTIENDTKQRQSSGKKPDFHRKCKFSEIYPIIQHSIT